MTAPDDARRVAEGRGEFSIGGGLWPGLSKLIEEAGEVQQVCGKIIGACGADDHWDGTNLRDRLVSEMGDLLAAIHFVGDANALDWPAIYARSTEKLALFHKWHAPAARAAPAVDETELDRLRDVLAWFAKHGKALQAEVSTAHRSRGPGASEWMREDDRDFRSELAAALDIARAALNREGEA